MYQQPILKKVYTKPNHNFFISKNEDYSKNSRTQSPILIKSKDRFVKINLEDIVRIEAFGEYSKIITKNNTFLSDFGISALEQKLPWSIFYRVHRSSIINIDKIHEVYPYQNKYDIRMKNGDIVRVSKSYTDLIKQLIF